LASPVPDRPSNVIAILIAAACFVVGLLLICKELADQQHVEHLPQQAWGEPSVEKTARVIHGWVARSDSAPIDSRTEDARQWPPYPTPPLEDEEARSHNTEIAWGAAWLARAHGADTPLEGRSAGHNE